jgi:hypothetical protein
MTMLFSTENGMCGDENSPVLTKLFSAWRTRKCYSRNEKLAIPSHYWSLPNIDLRSPDSHAPRGKSMTV